MLVSSDARLLVSQNAILPSVAKYLNRLNTERYDVFRHSLNTAYLVAEMLFRDYSDDLLITKNEWDDIIKGALLHDVGKLEIDNKILLKKSALTDKEIDEIHQHPIYGYNIVKDDEGLSDMTKEIILSHHERSDGSGYPNGKTDIPDFVKIVGICDKYDALTENRSYRPKKDLVTTFKILMEEQNEVDLDMFLLLASISEK